MKLELAYVNKLLGMEYTPDEVKNLLERMRYGVKKEKGGFCVAIPAHRTDILHPMDLVEDVAIAYGYQNFIPEEDKIPTQARADPFEERVGDVRDVMVGAGFTEVRTLLLTSEAALFERMNAKPVDVVTTLNPVSEEHAVVRSWLLPSLMGVLEKNQSREYPQRIFEVGQCLAGDASERTHLASVSAHSKTNFSEMKATVCGLLESLGIEYDIKALKHPSFIEGRCAAAATGFFGEVNPAVLSNFTLQTPVTAFELPLTQLFV